jgi:hypothetical protein
MMGCMSCALSGLGALTADQATAMRAMAATAILSKYNIVPSEFMKSKGFATSMTTAANYLAGRYVEAKRNTLSAVPTQGEINNDQMLDAVVAQNAPASKSRVGGGGGSGGWGLNDQKIAGVPNYLLYAGGAALALVVLKKAKKY